MSDHCKSRRLVFATLALGIAALTACGEAHLRGTARRSPDGKTYLVIDDDNGGQACERILVDGQPWAHALHEKGEIAPGEHTIACGGEIGFVVPEGTTFHFDYWGP